MGSFGFDGDNECDGEMENQLLQIEEVGDVVGFMNHTFLLYTRGSTVAAARGATNNASSCLLRGFSTSILHPHMTHPAPTQSPESHICGVTVFWSNIFGPIRFRARQTE